MKGLLPVFLWNKFWSQSLPVVALLLMAGLVLAACGDEPTAKVIVVTATPAQTTSPATTVAPTTTTVAPTTTTVAQPTVAPTTMATTIAQPTVAPTTMATTEVPTSSETSTTASSTTPAASDQSSGKVGQELVGQIIAAQYQQYQKEAQQSDVRVTGVENFSTIVGYNEQFKPLNSSNIYLVVLYEAVNLSNTPLGSPAIFVKIQDGDGKLYEGTKQSSSTGGAPQAALLILDKNKYQLADTVQPNTVQKFFEVYEVPATASKFKLVVSNDSFKSSRTPSPNDFNQQTASTSGDNTSTSGAGQELVGQAISADETNTKTSIRVVAVERRTLIKYQTKSVSPTGVFLVISEDVAASGKNPSQPINAAQLLDSKGRTFSYLSGSDASLYLYESDPQKYPQTDSVSPGFVRRVTIIFDIPQDATNLKLQPASYLKGTRKVSPDDFKNSGGASADSGAGQELVGKSLINRGATYTVTKVQRTNQLTANGTPLVTTDGIFVLVIYDIKNTGSNSAYGSALKLMDDQGRSFYGSDYFSAGELDFVQQNNLKSPIIDAGKSGTAYGIYEIPKDAKGFTLQGVYNS